jgi:hypothetical protein
LLERQNQKIHKYKHITAAINAQPNNIPIIFTANRG